MYDQPQDGIDPVSVFERLDAYLLHVAEAHATGLAWNGLPIRHHDVMRPRPDRRDPGRALAVPGAADREALRRDVRSARKLLVFVGARLR